MSTQAATQAAIAAIARRHYLDGFSAAAQTVLELSQRVDYEGSKYTSRDALREYALNASRAHADYPDGSWGAGLEAGYYAAMGLEP